MAKLRLVVCRSCGQYIDRNIEKENIDWIMPSAKHYYHCKCYQNWYHDKDDIDITLDDQSYLTAAYQYLTCVLVIPINYGQFKNQWDNYITKKYTPKGIYYSLKYFYDIKHGNKDKANGGIGIVQYIYNEGTQYWARHRDELEKMEINLKKQLAALKQLDTREIVKRVIPKTKKKTIDDIVGQLGDDEI